MKAFVLAAAILAYGVCAAQAQSIEGGKWTIVRAGGANFPAELRAKTRFALARGQFSASAGCNGIGGTYTLDGPKVTFEGLVMTRMFCVDIDRYERALTQALHHARGWRLRGGALVIADGAGRQVLRLVPSQ